MHLVSEDQMFRWSDSVPDGAWVCGFSEKYSRSLDLLAAATGSTLQTTPGESHVTMWSALRESGIKDVPLRYALKGAGFQAYLKRLIRQSSDLLETYGDSYHAKEFVTIRQFLQGLVQCSINKKELYRIINSEDERTGALKTFIPLDSGLLPATTYSQISSCSGRLTITSGPSILTLRKDRRSLLRSARKKSKLVQIDFVSLEPRIALSISGNNTCSDVYEIVRSNALESSVNRDVAKIATISSLYGMSPRKLAKLIGDCEPSEAKKILEKIRKYFKISALEGRLKKEAEKDQTVKNHYGRQLSVENAPKHILVNRFIQSTAADGALLGFSKLMDDFSDRGLDIDPVFVIHDAVIVDVPDSSMREFLKIISNPLSIPGIDGSFPVATEIIA